MGKNENPLEVAVLTSDLPGITTAARKAENELKYQEHLVADDSNEKITGLVEIGIGVGSGPLVSNYSIKGLSSALYAGRRRRLICNINRR